MGKRVDPTAELSFIQARAEFDEIETRLGDLAAYISDIADELSHDPERLGVSLKGQWPHITTLLKLHTTWIERRDALIAAWRGLVHTGGSSPATVRSP